VSWKIIEKENYRFFRVATRDWKRRKKKTTLDQIGKAKPTEWYHYSTALTVIKFMQTKEPKLLHDSLINIYYTERRKQERFKFFNSSTHLIGHNAICNRLSEIFN